MAVTQEVIDRIVGNVRKRYPGWEGVNDPRFQEEEIRYKREVSPRCGCAPWDSASQGISRRR